jgi:TET-Associated Glycosyltransferase
MSEAVLYLPTHGRVDRQFTLKHLPKTWRERVIVLCPPNEVKALSRAWPDVYNVRGLAIGTLHEKRAWIFRNTKHEKIMMFDDDLKFAVRRKTWSGFKGFDQFDKDKWKALKASNPDYAGLERNEKKIAAMFKRLEQVLNTYAHVSVNERLMSQDAGYEFRMNARCLHVLGYHVPTVLDTCKLGRTEFHVDVDITLQLLSAGYENAIYCWGTKEQADVNAPGGMNRYRTPAKMRRCAKNMMKWHPGIVTVSAGGYASDAYQDFTKMRISWKKAIAQGLAKRGVDKGTID